MAKEKGANPTPSKTIGIIDFKAFLDKNSKTSLRQTNVTYLKTCKRLISEAKTLEIFGTQKDLVVLLILNNLCNNVKDIQNVANELFTLIIPFLNASKGTLTSVLSEPLCDLTKSMVDMCKAGDFHQVFQIWISIINILDTSIHRNRNLLNSLLVVLEKTFKIANPDGQTASYKTWESLIDNFALDKNLLVSAKRIKLLMQPLTSAKNYTEETNLARFDAWWHLAFRMEEKLHTDFSTVCLPLLNRTLNIPAGSSSSLVTKLNDPAEFIKVQLKGCEMLSRILELPITSSVGLASPKKVPLNSTKSLKEPIPNTVFLRHSNELLKHCKTALAIYKDNKQLQSAQYLLHLVLERMSAISKESKANKDAVSNFLHFFQNIVKENYLEPVNSLKLIDEVCRSLPTGLLSSHSLRPLSDSPEPVTMVPAFAFLEFMLKKEFFLQVLSNSIYISTFSRIVIAGAEDNASFLKYLNSVFKLSEDLFKQEEKIPLYQAEVLCKFWLKTCHVLLERVEMTQEINMGDNLEHNFSTLISALTMPSKILLRQPSLEITPDSKEQKCWENICRALFSFSAKMDSIESNTCCEELCYKILELVEVPIPCLNFWIFQSTCVGILIESMDFEALNVTSGVINHLPSGWKKKNSQTLGTLQSFCALLDKVLSSCLTLEDNFSKRKKSNTKALANHQTTCLNLVENFFTYIHNLEILLNLIEYLTPTFVIFLSWTAKKSGSVQFSQNVEAMWQALVEKFRLRCQSHGVCGQKHFDVLAPLLEVSLQHPLKGIEEKARKLWNSVFSQIRSELKLTDSFKKVLAKAIPPLVSTVDISSSEDANSSLFSFDLLPDIIECSGTSSLPGKFGTFNKSINVEETRKKIFNVPLDKLKDNDFIKIDSDKKGTAKLLTQHQKEVRKTRSFVPAMYNDLSQNTINDSQDTFLSNNKVSLPIESATIVDLQKEKSTEEHLSEVSHESFNDVALKQFSHDSLDGQTEMSNLVNNIIMELDQSQDKSLDTSEVIIDELNDDISKSDETDKTRHLGIVYELKNEANLIETDEPNIKDKSNQLKELVEADMMEQTSNVEQSFKFNVFEVPETINFTEDKVADSIMKFKSKSDITTNTMEVSTISYPYKEGGVLETECVTLLATSKRKRMGTDIRTRDVKKTKKGCVGSVSSTVSSKEKKNAIVVAMDRMKLPIGKKKPQSVVPKLCEKINASIIPIESAQNIPSKDAKKALSTEKDDSIEPTSSELLALISAHSSQGFKVCNKPEPIVIDIASSQNVLSSTIDLSSDSCSSQTQKSEVIKKKGKRKRKTSSSGPHDVPEKKVKLDPSVQDVPFLKTLLETIPVTSELSSITKSDADVENSKENKNPELGKHSELKDFKVVENEFGNSKLTENEPTAMEDCDEVPKLVQPSPQKDDPLISAITMESAEIEPTPTDSSKVDKSKSNLTKSLNVAIPPRNTRLQRLNTLITLGTKVVSPPETKTIVEKEQVLLLKMKISDLSSESKPESLGLDINEINNEDASERGEANEEPVKPIRAKESTEELIRAKEPIRAKESTEEIIRAKESTEEIIREKEYTEKPTEAMEANNEPNRIMEATYEPIGAEEANEKPIGAEEANEKPIGAEEANEKPIGAEEANEKPIGAEEAKEKPIGAEEANEKPIGAEEANEKPIGAEEANEKPIGAEEANEKPIGAEEANEKPIGAEEANEKPIGAEEANEKPIGAEEANEKPIGAEEANEKPIGADEANEKPIGAEEANEKPIGADEANEKPIGADEANEKPIGAEEANEKPIGVEEANEKPIGAEEANEKPIGAEEANEKPIGAEEANEKPIGTEEANEKPIGAEDVNEKPIGAEDVNEKPIGAEDVNEKPIGAEEVNGKPIGAEEATYEPISLSNLHKPMVSGEVLFTNKSLTSSSEDSPGEFFTTATASRLSFCSTDISSTTSDEFYATTMQSVTNDKDSTMDKLDNVFADPQEETGAHSPPMSTPQLKKHKQLLLGSSPLSRSQRILQAAINKTNSASPTNDGTPSRVESSKDSPKSSRTSAMIIDSPTTGILKSKRKKLSDGISEKSPSPTNKQRRVSFADPLTEQFLVESQRKSSRRLKLVAMEIDSSSVEPIPLLETSFLQDPSTENDSQLTGDITTSPKDLELESQEPVYSQLLQCTEKVQLILNYITSSFWVRSLEELLESKNIHSIGDLCKLTPLDINSLPLLEPKVSTLISVLTKHLETCVFTTTSIDNEAEKPQIETLIEETETKTTKDDADKNKDEEVEKIIEKYLTPEKTTGIDCSLPKITPLNFEIEVRNELAIPVDDRLRVLNSADFTKEVIKRMKTMSQFEITELCTKVTMEAHKLINQLD